MKVSLPHDHFRYLPAVLIAAAVGALVMAPAFVADAYPAFGDNITFWAPSTAFWKAQVQDGAYPLWNPYVLGGIPFAADINHGLLYPPHWIAFFLDAPMALAVLLAAHIALAALGAFFFLESEGVAAPWATWGGVIFAVSTPFLVLVNHVVMLESMAYLPWVLWAVSRISKGAGWPTALLGGVALGLSALAGDVHATYMAGLAGGVYALVKALERFADGQRRQAGRIVLLFAVSSAVAVCLAAGALLPAFEFASQTVRAGGSRSYASYHGLDLRGALGVVFPRFWGSLSEGNAWNVRWSDAVLLGMPLVMMAVLGARKLRGRLSGAVLVLLGVGLAPGAASIIWVVFYNVLPGFRNFRQPREYFVIAALGAILLAAWALGDLHGAKPAARRSRGRRAGGRARVWCGDLLVVTGVLAGCYLAFGAPGSGRLGRFVAGAPALARAAGRSVAVSASVALMTGSFALAVLFGGRLRSRRTIAAIVVGVIILAETLYSSLGGIVLGPPDLYSADGTVASSVREKVAAVPAARFVPAGKSLGDYFGAFASRNITGRADLQRDAIDRMRRAKECLVDNEPVYARIESALGYSTFLPSRYQALAELATGAAQESPVRVSVSGEAYWALLGAGVVLEYDDAWRNRRLKSLDAPPPVYMAYRWQPAQSPRQAYDLIKADRAAAISAPVVEGPQLPEQPPAARAVHSVEDIRRAPGSVSALIYTDQSGLLVVMENNYPGWKAYDNGIETPIVTVNLAFKGVYLTEGRHEVVLAFKPKLIWVGLAISVIAFAAVGGLLAWERVSAWQG